MRAALFLLSLTLSLPALAGSYRDIDGKAWYIVEPPAKYLDSVDMDKVHVQFLPRRNVFAACETATGKAEQFGCAEDLGSRCSVVVVEDLPEPLRMAVLRHELAHCGPVTWPADHPTD